MWRFAVILCLGSVVKVKGQDCWWTGCQLDSWAVVGCNQYGRVESGKEDCSGGKKYKCCTGSGGQPYPTTPSQSSSERPSLSGMSLLFILTFLINVLCRKFE
jgi:hypothetical protein